MPQIEESDEPQPKDPEANVEGSTEKSSNEESDTVKKDEVSFLFYLLGRINRKRANKKICSDI